MDELPVDALPRIAEVDALPVDALPRIAEVDELPLVIDVPWTLPRAPPRADPAAQPPTPPSGDLGVVEIGIAVQLRHERLPDVDEVGVPGMEVVLVHGVVRVMGDRLRVMLHRTPEVRHKAVRVVDRFRAMRIGATEQDGTGTEERLDVVLHVTEVGPDERGRAGLAAKPREGRTKCPVPVRQHGAPRGYTAFLPPPIILLIHDFIVAQH